MTEALFVVIGGLLAIAAAATVAPRIGIASPLLLVLLGIGVSFLPFVPDVEVEPHWILTVVLPPLLYSAAVSIPEMDFRREFTAIRGLSVVLVALSAVLLGLFFSAVIPGLNLAWGIALGAIVSPTDAVATQIVKRVGVSGRITAVLEGEGLLNDATALVILRTAIAATVVSVSFGGVLWDFAFAVGAAVVIGFVVGHASMYVRARVKDPAVNTVVGFTVPFLAALPSEEIGASGLVAAVTAGLVVGRHAPEMLSPRHRLSDRENWRTVELILEGGIFLVMGLELSAIVEDAEGDLGTAATVAAAALALTLLIRAAYVALLLVGLGRRARRGARFKSPGHDHAGEARRGRPGGRRAGPQARSRQRGRAGAVPHPGPPPGRRHRLLPRRAARLARSAVSCGRACAARSRSRPRRRCPRTRPSARC